MNRKCEKKGKKSVVQNRKFKLTIIRFEHIMEGFVIFTVFIICFISSSAGLKCYRCNDAYPGYNNCSSEDLVVEACRYKRYGKFFCVTATTKSGAPYKYYYEKCEDRDQCTLKGCNHIGLKLCKEPGTFEVTRWYGNFTVTCCEGDLCNSFSSAHLCKQNLLHCGLLFTLFLLLSEWFTI